MYFILDKNVMLFEICDQPQNTIYLLLVGLVLYNDTFM